MALFNFTLQTVLDQRERDEQFLQMEHARARLGQRTLEEELAAIETELQTANESMRDKHLIGPIDAGLLATHRRYLIAMRTAVISVAQRIATARIEVEKSHRKLAEAAKQRKAIEVLRDRQKQRWLADQGRKELAAADDVGMQIAYHNLLANPLAGSSLA